MITGNKPITFNHLQLSIYPDPRELEKIKARSDILTKLISHWYKELEDDYVILRKTRFGVIIKRKQP